MAKGPPFTPAPQSTLLLEGQLPHPTWSSPPHTICGSDMPPPPPLFALRYGVDLTANAARLDPVIGRDEEIRRVVQVLCRRCVGVGARGVDQVWKMMGWGAARAAGAGDQHWQDSSKL